MVVMAITMRVTFMIVMRVRIHQRIVPGIKLNIKLKSAQPISVINNRLL
jgi:hypothetical protein